MFDSINLAKVWGGRLPDLIFYEKASETCTIMALPLCLLFRKTPRNVVPIIKYRKRTDCYRCIRLANHFQNAFLSCLNGKSYLSVNVSKSRKKNSTFILVEMLKFSILNGNIFIRVMKIHSCRYWVGTVRDCQILKETITGIFSFLLRCVSNE